MNDQNKPTKTETNAPLADIVVVDLTRVLAGPWATQLLADMGATVIKIERPGTGDDTRSWGPPFYMDKEQNRSDAAYFMAANRGKKSICIDLKSKEGQGLVRQLAANADVIVENFKVGAMAKMGLDFATLNNLNPKLIYCSITGFGQTGPMKDNPGYDYIIQALSGMMSITGSADGEADAGPMRTGVAISDLITGFYASNAILAALMHAQKTQEGQHIDLSLLDSQMAALINQATCWMQNGQTPVRTGSSHPNLTPYGIYNSSDGEFVLAIGNDAQFDRFCEFAGRSELSSDSRFRTSADRLENREALQACLVPVLASRPTDCWLEGLAAIGVPAGPIQNIPEAFDMEQSKARNMTLSQSRADLLQVIKTPASPIRFSKTPVSENIPPPSLGADSTEILKQNLQLSEFEIARLRKNKIVF